MKIRDFCSRVVVVAESGTNLREAARMMREHVVGSLIVIDQRGGATRPVGIITDRDILIAVVAQGIDPESLTVKDAMSPELAVLDADAGVFEAAETMAEFGARRLPVVCKDGKLMGIVTLDDVLRVISTELGYLSATIEHSARREVAKQAGKEPATFTGECQ